MAYGVRACTGAEWGEACLQPCIVCAKSLRCRLMRQGMLAGIHQPALCCDSWRVLDSVWAPLACSSVWACGLQHRELAEGLFKGMYRCYIMHQ